MLRVPEEVADMLRYRVYRSTMQRCRRLVQQAIMSALQEDVSEFDTGEDPMTVDEDGDYIDVNDELAGKYLVADHRVLRIKSDSRRPNVN